MRVGINCLATNPSYRGGTNSFTFGLLDGFVRIGDAHEFTIFATPGNTAIFREYEGVSNFQLVEMFAGPDHRWLQISHDRRLPMRVKRRLSSYATRVRGSRHDDVLARHADVVYVPYVPPLHYPLPDVPTVYSIHDIQHIRYPEFFTAEELLVRERTFETCVEHATVVQASSRYMADEFQDHFPTLNESNVEVIPEGVDTDLFSQSQRDNDVVARYGLPTSFLFTPAQLWQHKNHITILKALKRLSEQGLVIPWVLTGAEYSSSREVFDFIEANALDAQVFYLGVVPFEDLIALYQRARYLLTASLYESSSLTILEAAAAGTPIIASRIPPNEEMAETLEMRLFAPTDDAGLASVLEEAWADEEASKAQVDSNRVGVQRYSWNNAARMYLELFERLGARNRYRSREFRGWLSRWSPR